MRKRILFVLITLLVSGCASSTKEHDRLLEEKWIISHGQTDAISCTSKENDYNSDSGDITINFSCALNVSVKEGEIYALDNGRLFTEKESYEIDSLGDSYPTVERSPNFVSTIENAKPQKKFATQLTFEAQAEAQEKRVKFALWDSLNRYWIGTSNNVKVFIPLNPDLAERAAQAMESSAKDIASENQAENENRIGEFWYQEGYDEMLNRDPETLYGWGIAKAFGATGLPVREKMATFCWRITVFALEENNSETSLNSEEKVIARKYWNRGCTDAGMTLMLP